MDAPLLTPEQVARRLNITLNTIYIWLRQGRLPGVRIGHRWRVRPEALDQFLQQGCPDTPPPHAPVEEGGMAALARIAGTADSLVPEGAWAALPADGAANLDHYLYGTPKKDAAS